MSIQSDKRNLQDGFYNNSIVAQQNGIQNSNDKNISNVNVQYPLIHNQNYLNQGIPNGHHLKYPNQELRPVLGINPTMKTSSIPTFEGTPTYLSNGQRFQSAPPPQTVQQTQNVLPPQIAQLPQINSHPVLQQNKLVHQQTQFVPHPASPNATNFSIQNQTENLNVANNITQHQTQSENLIQSSTSKRRVYPQEAATNVQSLHGHLKPNIYNNQPGQNFNLSKGSPLTKQNDSNKMNQSPNAKNLNQVNTLMSRLTVEQSPTYPVNLLEQRQVITPKPFSPPKPPIAPELIKKNANPNILRCTFNAIPQTSSLQKQCKLPFGIHIHPFKEGTDMPIVSSVITRCRSCRSYLNPFVSIPDHRRWQCNMCFRLNDIPDELNYDVATGQYNDIRRRPELNCASIEFIAPSEYMLRPPQPSIFIFVFDVSHNALSTGYLKHSCDVLIQNLDALPGDSRTMIGFITFNSVIHFYSLKLSQSQPQMYVVSDLDEIFLPVPDGLMVNLKENKEMILQLLTTLPTSFEKVYDTHSATGAAINAAKSLISATGGRITLFQTCLPNIGPGKLVPRELASMSSDSKDTQFLNPSTDFYKRFSLDCAGEQIAVDLFLLSSQYSDLASLSCAPRYSSGAIHYFPDFHSTKNTEMLQKFLHDFKRYLTRSIGFEAVMRLRCTKGLSIHTFHGNFFVRSTDLLSLPNVNPDHSFSMQMSIEESLTDSTMVSFQAALLYTTVKGERRIRVHTLALPVTSKLSDVYAYADEEAILCSLSKLAVDRTLMSSLGDAREALMNACIDCSKTYRSELSGQKDSQGVIMPHHLRLLPLHVLALMKNVAFKLGNVSLDSRVFFLLEFKWQSLFETMISTYPRLYSALDFLEEHDEIYSGPPILHASAERLSRQGVYILDNCKKLYIFVGRDTQDSVVQCLFNVSNISMVPELSSRLPELNNNLSLKIRKFIEDLRKDRPFYSPLEVIREDGKHRFLFLSNLIDDRTESSMSYIEFLQHIQRQMNS
uniref:Protein transport protein Sec24A n=1 Tax=Hydra vulgaris TaxID=6087 RepID=T2MH92_HYDVU